MKVLGNMISAILLVSALSGSALSQDNSKKDDSTQSKLPEEYFVDDLLAYLSDEYNEIDPSNEVKSAYFPSIGIKTTKYYLKGKQGRNVPGYDGKIFNRTTISAHSAPDSVKCNELMNYLINDIAFNTPSVIPLVKPYPTGVHYPPIIIIKGITSIIVITIRCEDLLTEEGTQDDAWFWSKAEDIAHLIKGFKPELILVNGCGGPLRDMTELAGAKQAEEK